MMHSYKSAGVVAEMEHACSMCKRVLPLSAFYLPCGRKKLRFDWRCKECQNSRSRKWQRENSERHRETKRAYEKAHPEAKSRWDRRRYQKFKQATCITVKRPRVYPPRRDLTAYYLAYHAARRASMLRATPAWADETVIALFYRYSSGLSEALGTKFHVDHIAPLKGRHVCGLHVEHNLQILPAKENRRKLNRFVPS